MEVSARLLDFEFLAQLSLIGTLQPLNHLGYWIGDILGDLLLGIEDGEQAQVVPPYYDQLSQLVADATLSETVLQSNWRILTSKNIYSKL